MSALAEALVAAQRRAVAAVEKQYVAGKIEAEEVVALLNRVGLTDDVDQSRLVESLWIIRSYGATLPAETANGDGPRLASDAQRTFIADLCKRASVPVPELAGLTHEQASEMISSLKAGTYDPSKWEIPF